MSPHARDTNAKKKKGNLTKDSLFTPPLPRSPHPTRRCPMSLGHSPSVVIVVVVVPPQCQDLDLAFSEIDSAIQRHTTSLSGGSCSPGDTTCGVVVAGGGGGGGGAVGGGGVGHGARLGGGSTGQDRQKKRLRVDS